MTGLPPRAVPLPLTPSELRLLLHLRGQAMVTGAIPPQRLLARIVGLSWSRVHQLLEAIEHKGWIHREHGRHHAIRFVDPPAPEWG